MVFLGFEYMMEQYDQKGDGEGLLSVIIEALNSNELSQFDREKIISFLTPKAKTRFRLKITRRPGNHNQSDIFIEGFREFEEFYDNYNGEMDQIISTAEDSKKDGGLGISLTTAKKYLKLLNDIRREKRENE